METTSSLFPFKSRRCPAAPNAQNWQKAVGPKNTHPLSGEVRPEVVVMEALQPKKPYLRHGNRAKGLNYSGKHRKWGAEKWQQVLWTD